MTKTSVARTLEDASEKVQYDEHAKKLLGNKIILAWIIKSAVAEAQSMSVDEITRCIGETVEISQVPVNPGETNAPQRKDMPQDILGDNTESTIPYEGKITYDIRLHLWIPKNEHRKIKLLINVEAQKSYHQSYDFMTRGIFYGARMISAQHDTEFVGHNYQDIKKVYSIWILMNAPEYIGNAMTECRLEKTDLIGKTLSKKEAYDKMSVLLIYLNERQDQEGTNIFHLLNTLFSPQKRQRQKEKVLNEEFRIETNVKDEIGKEIQEMCNLSEVIEENALQKGEIIKLINQIKVKCDKNKPLEQIADELEEEINYIEPLYQLVNVNKDKTSDEIYKMIEK